MEKISWEGKYLLCSLQDGCRRLTELAADPQNRGGSDERRGKPYVQFRMKRGEDALEMTLLTLKKYRKTAAIRASDGKPAAANENKNILEKRTDTAVKRSFKSCF